MRGTASVAKANPLDAMRDTVTPTATSPPRDSEQESEEIAVGRPDDGLYPPLRSGRSARMIGEVIVDLGFADRETVEQAVAAEHERLPRCAVRRVPDIGALAGVLLASAPWRAPRESPSRRGGGGRMRLGIARIRVVRGVDEGVERVHRLPPSPPAGPLPASPSRKKSHEREVAGLRAGWPPVILGHFDSPCEGVIGFCRSSTMARRQRQRPGRKLAHPASRGVHSHAVRSMARIRTGSTSTR